MKLQQRHPGASVYFCVGRYGGFGVKRDGALWRLTLGWFAIGFGRFDLETFWGEVAHSFEASAEAAIAARKAGK